MQIHPSNWDLLLHQPHITQYRFTINGEVKTGDYIQGVPVIEKPMMLEPVIGRCCTGSLTITVRKADNEQIPKASPVEVDCRLASYDETTVSEWIPQGRYFVTKRQGFGELVSLTCRDSMINAGKTYRDKATIASWPASMADVLDDIADLMDVEIDSRTEINTGEGYTLGQPEEDVLMSEVLCQIAAVHGGNFIITEAGKLRLVPFPITADPVFSLNQSYKTYTPYSDGENTISRIIMKNSAGQQYTVGDDTGVWIQGECETVSQALTDKLAGGAYRFENGTFYFPSGTFVNETAVITDTALEVTTAGTVRTLVNGLLGRHYVPYRLDGAYIDPCIELGDTFTVLYRGRTLQLIANTITVNCTTGYTCHVENGVMYDDEEEVVYVTPQEKQQERTSARSVRNASGVSLLNEKTGISSLTGDETLYTRILQTDAAITQEAVDRANGDASVVEQTTTAISFKVSKGEVSTELAVELNNVTITNGNLLVDGYITADTLFSGQTYAGSLSVTGTIGAGTVGAGTVQCSTFKMPDGDDGWDTYQAKQVKIGGTTQDLWLLGTGDLNVLDIPTGGGLTNATVANNILTITKSDGTTVNFSKATSVSGEWGSNPQGQPTGTFTVTATQTNRNTTSGEDETTEVGRVFTSITQAGHWGNSSNQEDPNVYYQNTNATINTSQALHAVKTATIDASGRYYAGKASVGVTPVSYVAIQGTNYPTSQTFSVDSTGRTDASGNENNLHRDITVSLDVDSNYAYLKHGSDIIARIQNSGGGGTPKVSRTSWSNGIVTFSGSSNQSDAASIPLKILTESNATGTLDSATTPTKITFDIHEDTGSGTTADTGADIVAAITRTAATLKLSNFDETNSKFTVQANTVGSVSVGQQRIQVGVTAFDIAVVKGTATPNEPEWHSSGTYAGKYTITADGSFTVGGKTVAQNQGSISGGFTPTAAINHGFGICHDSIGLSVASRTLEPGGSPLTIYPTAKETPVASTVSNITSKGITITPRALNLQTKTFTANTDGPVTCDSGYDGFGAITVTVPSSGGGKVHKGSWSGGAITFSASSASSDQETAGVSLNMGITAAPTNQDTTSTTVTVKDGTGSGAANTGASLILALTQGTWDYPAAHQKVVQLRANGTSGTMIGRVTVDATTVYQAGQRSVTVTGASIEANSVTYTGRIGRTATGNMLVRLSNMDEDDDPIRLTGIQLDAVYQSGLDGGSDYTSTADFEFVLTDGDDSWLGYYEDIPVSEIYQQGRRDAAPAVNRTYIYNSSGEKVHVYKSLDYMSGGYLGWIYPNTPVSKATTKYSRYYKITYQGISGYVWESALIDSTSTTPSPSLYTDIGWVPEYPYTSYVFAATGSTVWIRKTANTSASTVCAVPVGDSISCKENPNGYSGTWMEVKYGDKTGYMMAQYIAGTNEYYSHQGGSGMDETYRWATRVLSVSSSSVPLYSSSSTSSSVVTTVPHNSVIYCADEYRTAGVEWVRVKYGTSTGYMEAKYIRGTDACDQEQQEAAEQLDIYVSGVYYTGSKTGVVNFANVWVYYTYTNSGFDSFVLKGSKSACNATDTRYNANSQMIRQIESDDERLSGETVHVVFNDGSEVEKTVVYAV